MVALDYAVLLGYFLTMAVIGVWAMRRVHVQEDYFMGGRSFGKLMQTFAAFGAGTGSSDPVNTGRTTFTSGMSGMWSVMYWLFVTPFYWFTGVWYRRMRHLTLGDWYVERYESRALGAAYALFGMFFFMAYGSMLFSAIGKVAAPLIGSGTFSLGERAIGIEYLLVPIIGVVVLLYGIMGGLRAAYWTDLIQGLCIVLLSIMLIPFGLRKLVEEFGDPQTEGLWDGFRIMHEQLPPEHFSIVGSTSASEFPVYFILVVVLINLVGVVVQPHFIVTGGGSAKTETNARVGLVLGNFLKRFCTVGWALTALIALALFSGSPELVKDPDKTWGVASRELLGPGLTGLMLACLLAALMSSVDAYMIVGSALMVRNIYAAYINPEATEKEYVRLARFTGTIIVGGSIVMSLSTMDVFEQLQLTWIIPMLFAAPFWIGIFWRRATSSAAWATVICSALMLFVIPWLVPRLWPQLHENPILSRVNDTIVTVSTRIAAPSDVKAQAGKIKVWNAAYENVMVADQHVLETFQHWDNSQSFNDRGDQFQNRGVAALPPAAALAEQSEALGRLSAAKDELEKLGERPEPIQVGDTMETTSVVGGIPIFWSGQVHVIDDQGQVLPDVTPSQVGPPQTVDDTTQTVYRYEPTVRLRSEGNFQFDLLIYQWLGIDLSTKSTVMLKTLALPPKIVTPFLVMIGVSLITRRNKKESLDRYYAKMRTPVVPDADQDREMLARAYQDPSQTNRRKLFPNTDLEFQKPTSTDVIGFLICLTACFGIVGLAIWVASIGS